MTMKKILVVDDDHDQQAGLRVRLTANGYEVVSAHDAMQAVSVARKELPDLVLLDIGLPGGDGHTVFERMRGLTPTAHIPIIVLSAKDPAGHKERMLESGAAAYFQKPAPDAELLAAIRKALGEPDPQDETETAEVKETLRVV